MKKLLYISFLFSICLFAQTNTQYIEQDRPLNLVEGWNMIGFTCNEPINVIDAFLPIYDKVIIAKDIASLEALVSLKMSQGWKTTGGIFVDGAGNCLQSMRYSKNTI